MSKDEREEYRGHCGYCKEYTYEGEDKKGFCSHFRDSYYPNDSCKHQINLDYNKNCFLTTACCQYQNLPDDCIELQTLRRFRDTWLIKQDFGSDIIDLYYKDAPNIVDAIEQNQHKEQTWNKVYEKIKEIVKMIDNKQYELSTCEYLLLVYKLKTRNDL